MYIRYLRDVKEIPYHLLKRITITKNSSSYIYTYFSDNLKTVFILNRYQLDNYLKLSANEVLGSSLEVPKTACSQLHIKWNLWFIGLSGNMTWLLFNVILSVVYLICLTHLLTKMNIPNQLTLSFKYNVNQYAY